MRDEIIAGLQNALARGQTLEQAAQSFINAGYNPQEVKAAYQMLSSGATNTVMNANAPSGQGVQIQQNTSQAVGNYGQRQPLPQNQMNAKQAQQPTMQSVIPAAPPNNRPEKKKSGTAILITMIVIAALILLGALGYLFYVLYATQ